MPQGSANAGLTRYLHVRRILRGLQVLQSSPWVLYSWSGWRRILLVKSCRLAVGRCMSRADGCGRTLVVRMCQVGRTRGNVLSLNLVGKHLSHSLWRMLSQPGQRSTLTCCKVHPTWGGHCLPTRSANLCVGYRSCKAPHGYFTHGQGGVRCC